MALAKTVAGGDSQNGRILVGTFLKPINDTIFQISEDSLKSVASQINTCCKDNIKQSFNESNQTQFVIIFSSNNSSVIPDTENEGRKNGIITYYIDVTCVSQGSDASNDPEFINKNGYVIYSPYKPCLKVFANFFNEELITINECADAETDVIKTGIKLQAQRHLPTFEELLSGGGCETIGQMLVQEMEKQKNKKRTFIIEYEVNLGGGYTIQEVIAEALIVQYSSSSSDKDRLFILRGIDENSAQIKAEYEEDQYQYSYIVIQ